MSARLFVGNLSYNTGDESLHSAFSAHGAVTSATVVLDRETGRSRGFGFVEYGNAAEAQRAMQAMNGSMLDGRSIVVNEARAREPRGGGGGGGGGGRDRGDRGGRRERW
jgi:RNA recognition motif-containing protein